MISLQVGSCMDMGRPGDRRGSPEAAAWTGPCTRPGAAAGALILRAQGRCPPQEAWALDYLSYDGRRRGSSSAGHVRSRNPAREQNSGCDRSQGSTREAVLLSVMPSESQRAAIEGQSLA